MPFIHAINPTIIKLGPLDIRWYGLVYVIGFLLSYLYLRHLVKKRWLNLKNEELYDWIFYCMLGVLIGSRLVHMLFWEPMYYLAQPWKIFFVWEGGMAFHGGLIGVVLATYYFWHFKIKKKVNFWRMTDALAIPALFSLALGRIANFINGELPGTVTEVSWCWYFPSYDGCRHPQVLYSAAKRFLIVGWLVWLRSKEKFKDGFISVNMLILVGLGRFLIDFVKEDPRFLYLTAGQYLSLIMIIIGTYFLIKTYKKDMKRLFS
ncbi:prolipoprotein diacylglyceryl transferase [Nanoarchaeota archaeon]